MCVRLLSCSLARLLSGRQHALCSPRAQQSRGLGWFRDLLNSVCMCVCVYTHTHMHLLIICFTQPCSHRDSCVCVCVYVCVRARASVCGVCMRVTQPSSRWDCPSPATGLGLQWLFSLLALDACTHCLPATDPRPVHAAGCVIERRLLRSWTPGHILSAQRLPL